MPRIRSIKPDFFVSEDVSPLPLRARLTWIGLWTQCDDHGRTKDNVRLIKAALWALDEVTLADIEDDLAQLHEAGRIVRYQADGKGYLAVVNWHSHQAINRPGKARHPAPPVPVNATDPTDPGYCPECAVGSPPPLTEDAVSPHGSLTPGKEGKGKEGNAPATPPQQPSRIGLVSALPPRKCSRHINDPNPPSCGPCKDARKAADGVPTNVPVTPPCPLHPDQLTGSKACPRCVTENAPPPTDFRSRVGA